MLVGVDRLDYSKGLEERLAGYEQFLADNPDLANELEKRILEKLGVGPTVDAPAEGDDLSDEPIGVDDF